MSTGAGGAAANASSAAGGEAKTAASPFGATAADDTTTRASSLSLSLSSSSSAMSDADVTRITALCTCAWYGDDVAPLWHESNLPFVRFNGVVVDRVTHERMALFAVPNTTSTTTATATAAGAAPPAAKQADTAAADGGGGGGGGSAAAGAGGGGHATKLPHKSHHKHPVVTFKLLPLRAIHGLDHHNNRNAAAAAIELVSVRPLFYAAASGSRAAVEALVSAYKKLDADCYGVTAAVAEVKPHPDRAGEWNLISDVTAQGGMQQYDAATLARCNGHDDVAQLLAHPNARSCTDSRSCRQDCTLM